MFHNELRRMAREYNSPQRLKLFHARSEVRDNAMHRSRTASLARGVHTQPRWPVGEVARSIRSNSQSSDLACPGLSGWPVERWNDLGKHCESSRVSLTGEEAA